MSCTGLDPRGRASESYQWARTGRRGLGLLAATGLLATLLVAPGVRALGLHEYVAGAVRSDPQVREEIHRYRQVLQDHEIALSGWRPSLDLNLSVGAASRQAAGTAQRRREFDSSEASVTLTQNLFSGFDTSNEIEQARARITSAAYRVYDTADNVALDAVTAYVGVLEQRRLQELAAQNVESHERILAQIKELSDQGLIRRSDLEQTQGRLARAHAGLIAQQNNLEDAVTQFHKLLGRYVPPAALTEATLLTRDEQAIDELIAAALRAHPAIESAKYNVSSAFAAYQRSRATNYPRLDLQVRQQMGNDIDGPNGRTEDSSLMLNLTYNLFRGGADEAEQRKSASEIQVQQAFQARVRRQVIDTLRLAWSADRALEGQLPFLTRHSAKSLETVELYRDEFVVQKRDLIDLLDAENELNQALSAEARAYYALVLARYRVREGLGALFPELDLSVEVGERTLQIAALRGDGVDEPVLVRDRDADDQADADDQCDNSAVTTGSNGCADAAPVPLGYAAVAQVFVAGDDSFRSPQNETLVLPLERLLENDNASPRDAPGLRSVTRAEHGAVELGDDQHIFYQPKPGFLGTDTFTYTIGDRRARSATATVTVEVVPRAPAAAQLATFYFASDSRSLTDESARQLEALARELSAHPDVRIEIRGYADSRGSRGYNQRLSRWRAETIQRVLIGRGIAPSRIKARGMGEEGQDADSADPKSQQQARRAELRFSYGTGG